MEIQGHTAFVTGGASGLGEATARELRAQGAAIAILDLQAEHGERVAAELDGHFSACDVADETSTTAALEAAQAALGAPRILINCAGIGPAQKTTSRGRPHDLALFEKVIRVNLIGTFNVTRLAATAMAELEPLAEGERGVVINTASVAAYDGQIGQAAYAASKGGIVALTLPMARDLADLGIRVVTIAPGIFSTPLLATLPDSVRDSLAQAVPFPKKLGRPEDYAALARHIVENVMLNGETIRLDGAIRMAPR